MKNQLFVLLALSMASSLFGATVKAKCTNVSSDGFIEDKTMNVTITASKVKATSKNNNVEGDFDRVIDNKSRMYSSNDLLQLADQSDYAYIFISPTLAKGNDGEMTFTIHQLGDSEGAWWLKNKFRCKVTN